MRYVRCKIKFLRLNNDQPVNFSIVGAFFLNVDYSDSHLKEKYIRISLTLDMFVLQILQVLPSDCQYCIYK